MPGADGARPRGPRARSVRRTGGVPGLAAAAVVVALVAIAPGTLGTASTSLFPGISWSRHQYTSGAGCAGGHSFGISLAPKTGDGRLNASAAAFACTAPRGGRNVTSTATADSELDLAVPVTLATGVGGVNVTLNLSAGVSAIASLTGSNFYCPTTVTYYHYPPPWNYTTWVKSGDCFVGASVEVIAWAHPEELTTGTYYGSPTFFDSLTTDFIENYTYLYPAGAAYNNSYAINGTFTNTTGPSLAGPAPATFYLNGSFLRADRYEVWVSISADATAEFRGFPTGAVVARARAALGGTHYHADLQPIVIW